MQWAYLCKNIGEWQGQFLRFDAKGKLLSAEPSLTVLALDPDGKTMHQTVQVGGSTKQFAYRSLSRGVLFFANGAFSHGSTQFAPLAEFGAEFGFIHDRQRLRLVMLYQAGQLQSLTLIPEHLPDAPPLDPQPVARQALPPAQWVQGTVIFPDGRTPSPIQALNEWTTSQELLFLPYGAIVLCPPRLAPREPFSLQVVWQAKPHLFYWMVRSYDQMGGWHDLQLFQA